MLLEYVYRKEILVYLLSSLEYYIIFILYIYENIFLFHLSINIDLKPI